MKIHDFGLWFQTFDSGTYSTTIPQKGNFKIIYDGSYIGFQTHTHKFDLRIWDDLPYIINLKNNFKKDGPYYSINRLITLDDFEVIPNPDYKGIK
jgi:hypothetical protein